MGAGAMSGHTKGLSSRVLNLNEKAIYVHCYSHRLNLAICASCNIQYVENLLAHVKDVSYFFNLSPTRQQNLKEHIERTAPVAEKVNGLDTFQELFIPLVSCLEEIFLNVNKSFIHSTSSGASSLLKLITGFDFIVALCITRNVFDITLPVTRMLQSKSNDIYDDLNLIRALKDIISLLRSTADQHHQICYEQALKKAHELNITEAKPITSFISKNRKNAPSECVSDYFKIAISIPLLDHLSTDLSTRADLPDPLALPGELDLWEAYWLKFELLATFPLTSCECERTFSLLRRLKNYTRSTMVEERLNGLALMNIHTESVIDIEKVIDKFAINNRRLNLFISKLEKNEDGCP
ncbi:52 kDa repressor of the inhibitor of the protein kinase-like [Hydra vulgaris]|uniref:52 kDa repressor of the inhibitor of the protein kinase-like n=1 Tax=Hydra vulgaris TaxID=6087 RepID=A0ABM4BUF0_HYDVU